MTRVPLKQKSKNQGSGGMTGIGLFSLFLTMEEGIHKPRKVGSLWKLGRETKLISSPTGQGEGTQPC